MGSWAGKEQARGKEEAPSETLPRITHKVRRLGVRVETGAMTSPFGDSWGRANRCDFCGGPEQSRDPWKQLQECSSQNFPTE